MEAQYERIDRELWNRYQAQQRAGANTSHINNRRHRVANTYTAIRNSMLDAYTGRNGAYQAAKAQGLKGGDVYDEYTYREDKSASAYAPRFYNTKFGYKQRRGVGKWNSEPLAKGIVSG